MQTGRLFVAEETQPRERALGNAGPAHDELGWASRIDPRFRPVWVGRPPHEQAALALYFLPHDSKKALLAPTRPRLIKWYCPFAAQSVFPSGHRYCVNVYTGCAFGCVYCYAAAYEPGIAGPKRNFARWLSNDLEDLERFDVPAAPVHLSNSTDPFQPLELKLGHTKQTLEGLLAYRHRFTTVTVITKNPLLAARPDYLQLLKALGEIGPSHPGRAKLSAANQPAVQVEVSVAFWREAACRFYDRSGPPLADRLDGIRALRAADIPVVLRIDPLFLRSPLPLKPGPSLKQFGLPEAQPLDDLEELVVFAKSMQVRHVVYSPLKIVRPRAHSLSPPMQCMLAVYRAVSAPEQPVWKGRSWRLPTRIARTHLIEPFLEICRRHGVHAKFCMSNLVETI